MKQVKRLALLILILTGLFIVSCVKQPVIPDVPANLRATALAGVVGVELRWDAVAGATSYDVTLTKLAVSGSRETFGPYDTTNTYYLATRDVLGAGDFDWNVNAKNAAGSSDPAGGPEFYLPAVPEPEPEYGLVLELEERPDMASSRTDIPTIYVVRTGSGETVHPRPYNPEFTQLNYFIGRLAKIFLGDSRQNMSVQFLIEELDENGLSKGEAKRWPDSDTEFLLDEEGELVFYVNDLGENFRYKKTSQRDRYDFVLIPGQYHLWARAAWDNSVESTKVRFNITLVDNELDAMIRLMDTEGHEYTAKVCPTSTEVTLVYDVSIWGGEVFDSLSYAFQIGSAVDVPVTLSGAFFDETAFSTEVTFATECTKYATLTVDGIATAVYWNEEDATEATDVVLVTGILVDGIFFVLDMANPTAYATVVDFPVLAPYTAASLTAATMTFFATDTKCLQPYEEKIAFEIYVWKGIGDWEKTFVYGEEEVMIESDEWDNDIRITTEYGSATSTEADSVMGTMVLNFGNMDLAIIFGTMTVHDCCGTDCTLEDPCVDCGVGGNITHATVVNLGFSLDNVFFSEMVLERYGLDSILSFDGFLDGATRTIPASPANATLTIKLADALWDSFEMDWRFYDDGMLFEGLSFEPIWTEGATLAICSGFATKTEITYVGTLTADPEKVGVIETLLTLVATAIDNSGNEFVFSHDFILDTLPPTLSHFSAFRNQHINESWIEFAFDQKPETAELDIVVAGSGTFSYDLDDAEEIEGQENTYKLETGVTLPFGGAVTLNATATDLAGNVGFSTKDATVSLSSPR
ncbi:MAG TPA: hypothetical protein PKW59_13290 [Thermotogota bacterium]|nr:hypothetical protein [Thermotogota bacterium]